MAVSLSGVATAMPVEVKMIGQEIVDVAVAILLREDGAFLLEQRPAGKVYEGYWGFPGGKIEAGETPLHALRRELHEELGITEVTAHPWLTQVCTYPHATVRLHFFRVFAWRGEPHGHENQQLSWQRLPLLDVAPLLPGDAPLLRALELPEVYAISNAAELGCEEFMLRLERALHNGLRLVQVREKNLPHAVLAQFAAQVVQLAHRHGAKVLVHGDAVLARRAGADGVHFSGAQLRDCHSRPDCDWCSVSCHSTMEVQRAAELGFDCALLSPVLPTQSHHGAAHLGWEKFAAMLQGTAIPVYALGGLTPDDLPIAQRHGAHGIAMLRQAW